MRQSVTTGFYTPFGVRCFGTVPGIEARYYAVCFYTPFGVRCFGTTDGAASNRELRRFLYALRREVLRNIGEVQ